MNTFKAFSIARGIICSYFKPFCYGEVVCGYHPKSWYYDSTDCLSLIHTLGKDAQSYHVDQNLITYNIGFSDCNGNTIFTGDYISFNGDDNKSLVYFDENEGAFFYGGGRNRKRLTRERAATCHIVSNIYDKLRLNK